MIGQSISHYRITAKLGAGGMGEVYRATDTKLAREVAIKVLPEAFTSDAQRMARFHREAQLLAAVNHPNIASIYGIEESGALHALVIELVGGPTLAERIERGALPLDEALPIAKQIAEALEYAHERGIIHRDLKPANIKLTSDGKVKILDFGLAKALSDNAAAADASNSPTLSMGATKAGIILGTVAYMSPEQAQGKGVDRRADIWSFGVVLYEMLTGKQAYPGETAADILAKVLEREPDWNALPSRTPERIRELLHRCLTKDAQQRLRDIGDARLEIDEALSMPSRDWVVSGPAVGAPRTRWRAVPWGVAALGTVLAAVALWGWWHPSAPTLQPLARLFMPLPPSEPLWVRTGASIALSPDGERLVYVASRGGETLLYLRSMDQLEATPMPGTQGAEGPFFSPDGQWVGFVADHKMKKTSIRGGAPSILCGAPVSLGASWALDDTIVMAVSPNAGLLRVSAAGGTPQVLTALDLKKGESGHYWPEFLPGGKAVIYTVVTTSGDARIAALQLDTGHSQELIDGGTNPRYSPTGHLVFARGGALMAARFDPERLRVTGPAVPVLDGVLNTVFAGAQFSFSRGGLLVYVPGGLQALDRSLVWVDRKGVARPMAAPTRPYMDPRISPDGKQLLFEIYEGTKGDIWAYELARGTLTRLTFEGYENETPLWKPREHRIVLSSSRGGAPMSVFWRPADGSGSEEKLLSRDHHLHLNSISPDGRLLALTDYHPVSGGDIWLVPLEGEHRPQPLLQTPFNEWGAVFSPDGHWLAYVSNESGRDEIYVQPFPALDRKWQISTQGGTEPVWARSGRELFYRDGDKMMAAAVATQPTFSAAKPALLFEGRYARGLTLGHTNYDISPDGQRFLMLKASEQESAPTQLNFVLNWFDELRRHFTTGAK